MMMMRPSRWLMLAIVPLLALVMLLLSPVDTVADAGTNWVAQFYNNTTLSDPAAVTGVIYPTGLNFTWAAQPQDATGTPIAGVSADGWSARYVTTETINAGTYEFIVTGDDGYRLFIDGNPDPIINNLSSTGLTTTAVRVPLTGGVYTLIVEHVDVSGSASIQVNWFLDTTSTDPQPEVTQAPPATGAVERVRGLAVRTGPFLGASLINVARPNKQYPILARNTQEGLYTWYLIQIDETQTGWSSGRYLAVSGDINSINVAGSVFDSIGTPPDIGVRGVTRSVMNLRRLPTQRSERIGQLDWGAEVVILARTVQGGRDHWYMVRYNDVIGWIFAPYVGVRGNIIDIPIY